MSAFISKPIATVFVFALFSIVAAAQNVSERDVAARFAPVFYQGLGDEPRSDYITNFDFDGDWRGDNNWVSAGHKKHTLRAYVYYSVSETATHYFVHYAVFHPRDYKGGSDKGRMLSDLMRQGAKILGKRDPTGRLKYATAAHENDMEGALVVVSKGAKSEDDRVVFLETHAHNTFAKYADGDIRRADVEWLVLDDGRPHLYIEPRGHGVRGYLESDVENTRRALTYRFTGQADDPEKVSGKAIGYELLSIKDTLWPRAFSTGKANSTTYGSVHDYKSISIRIASATGKDSLRKIDLGSVGNAFLGASGGQNMARPPWGWFDTKRKAEPLGAWFFDPALVIKRDFDLGESFSTVYLKLPFWAEPRF